jgi:hypothetical protein
MNEVLREKVIKRNGGKKLFMQVFQWNNIVAGLVVLLLAVILLYDAISVTFTSANELFSPNEVKGITGLGFLIIATFIIIKARENK